MRSIEVIGLCYWVVDHVYRYDGGIDNTKTLSRFSLEALCVVVVVGSSC
jgi:hypothetical protein